MFKFVVLVTLLCREICVIAGQPAIKPTDTAMPPLSSQPVDDPGNDPSVNASREVPRSLGQYNYATHQTFYISSPWDWKKPTSNGNVGKEIRGDYIVMNGFGAYKLNRRKLSWNAARNMCVQEGAHLAVIRSVEEAKVVKSVMLKDSVNWAWVGFHDSFQEGDWVTVLDEPIASLEWDPWAKSKPYEFVPDDWKGNEDCTEFMVPQLALNDLNCALLYPFVCKIDL